LAQTPIVKIVSPDHKELLQVGSGISINIVALHSEIYYVNVDITIDGQKVISNERCFPYREYEAELPLVCYSYHLSPEFVSSGSSVQVTASAFSKSGVGRDSTSFTVIDSAVYYYDEFSDLEAISTTFSSAPVPGLHIVSLAAGTYEWPEFKSSGYEDINIEPTDLSLLVIKGSEGTVLNNVNCNIGNCVFDSCVIQNTTTDQPALSLRQKSYVKVINCTLRGYAGDINEEKSVGIKSGADRFLNVKSSFLSSFRTAIDSPDSVRFCKFDSIGDCCVKSLNRIADGNTLNKLLSLTTKSSFVELKSSSSGVVVKENYCNNLSGTFINCDQLNISNLAIYGNTVLSNTNTNDLGLVLSPRTLNNFYIVNNSISPNSSSSSSGFRLQGTCKNGYLANNFFNYDLTSNSLYTADVVYRNNATKGNTFGADSLSNVTISSFKYSVLYFEVKFRIKQ
jgi:hypothetical protein